MLSRYLKKLFDQIIFWGFTATANYTVVEDVQKQLDIPQDNFFAPISFERFNVRYDFRELNSTEEMLSELKIITEQAVRKNERTIVFTKSDEISDLVADAIGFEADVFSINNPDGYHHFADERCKILVASSEIGVGINLPNIRNIVHFGIPLSKNEFVQEIGRAGRASENVTSYVLYLKNTVDNVPRGLLRRDNTLSDLPTILEGYNNDYSDVYRKLTNGALSSNVLYDQLIRLYNTFFARQQALFTYKCPFDKVDSIKQQLYMLYLSGYINDWYTYSMSQDGTGIDILVDIYASNADRYEKDSALMLRRMKEHLRDYFDYMGNDRENIAEVSRADSPEKVILIYVNWYYKKYLYHQNEQFLDFYDFLIQNSECDRDRITEEIKDFYVLPFAQLQSDETLYTEMPIKDIIRKTTTGISKKTLLNLERINSNRYSVNVDVALLCGQLRMNDVFHESRADRVLSMLDEEDLSLLINSFVKVYPSLGIPTKIDLLKYLEENASKLEISFDTTVERMYQDGYKDMVYYGLMAQIINDSFRKFRRS